MAPGVEDLSRQIKLVRQWDSDSIQPLLRSILEYGEQFDASVGMLPIEAQIQALQLCAPFSFHLGTGGAVVLTPIPPGLQAAVHIYIWDPAWRKQYPLLRDLARWVFKKWGFQRVTGLIPARHTASAHIAEQIGFSLEGTMRRGVRYTRGEEVHLDDVLVYGLLPEEVPDG